MIRPAALADIPALVEMGRQLCAESPRWQRLASSAEKLESLLALLIESERGFAYVGERDGQVAAALLAVLDEHWASDDQIATELSLFVAPEARGSMLAVRLITHMVAWANVKGAKWLHAGASTGIDDDKTVALYERLGFTRCSTGLEVVYGC